MTDTQASTEAAPEPTPEPEPTPTPPERPWPTNVVQALARVAEELPGIGKDAQAAPAQGGYAYRSIEAITAAAGHLLGRYGVVFVPKVVRRPPPLQLQVAGKPWTQEEMEIVYTVYGPGGVDDRIEVGPLVALGRDNVDKGTNKCMTQAYKYALLQVLCIGDNKDDADSGSAQADAHANAPDPDQWYKANGWAHVAEHDEFRTELGERLAAATPEVRTAFGQWFRTQGVQWTAAWTRQEAEEREAKVNELTGRQPEPTQAPVPPQAAQDGPAAPEGTDTPPAPETAAGDPHSAPPEPEPQAMPWDDLPPMDEDARKAAIVLHANSLATEALTAALEAEGLAVGGTEKARRQRLANALVAKGWRPGQD